MAIVSAAFIGRINMSIWFVSRHPGARNWACEQKLQVNHWCDHLDINKVKAGDIVIGTLPLPLAVEVCQRGAEYWHLALELPANLRGVELSTRDLHLLGARLVRYDLSCCRVLPFDKATHP